MYSVLLTVVMVAEVSVVLPVVQLLVSAAGAYLYSKLPEPVHVRVTSSAWRSTTAGAVGGMQSSDSTTTLSMCRSLSPPVTVLSP